MSISHSETFTVITGTVHNWVSHGVFSCMPLKDCPTVQCGFNWDAVSCSFCQLSTANVSWWRPGLAFFGAVMLT